MLCAKECLLQVFNSLDKRMTESPKLATLKKCNQSPLANKKWRRERMQEKAELDWNSSMYNSRQEGFRIGYEIGFRRGYLIGLFESMGATHLNAMEGLVTRMLNSEIISEDHHTELTEVLGEIHRIQASRASLLKP